jgi:hypothetical protein
MAPNKNTIINGHFSSCVPLHDSFSLKISENNGMVTVKCLPTAFLYLSMQMSCRTAGVPCVVAGHLQY